MLWNNINLLLVSALGAVSCVSAAENIVQAINDMNNMSDKIAAAKTTLDNYNGGLLAALGVARSLTVAQTSARTSREHLEENDSLTPEEGSRYLENYEHMAPILLGAIQSAQEKVSHSLPTKKFLLMRYLRRPPCSRNQDWVLRLGHI
jgi:hypothetical protein